MKITSFASTRSFAHQLNARVKSAALIISLMVILWVDNWLALAAMAIFCIVGFYAAGYGFADILRILKFFWIFLVITIVYHTLFTGDRILINLPFNLHITIDGILNGLFISMKIFFMAVLMSGLLHSTHPTELAGAFQIRRAPAGRLEKHIKRTMFIVGFAVGLMPRVLNEAERIYKAQIGRGLMVGAGISGRAKSLAPLLIPILTAVFRRAELITIALMTRGFKIENRQTQYKPLKFSTRDGLAIAVSTITIAAVILLNLKL